MNAFNSRFRVPGDGKALIRARTADNQELIIASQNQDSLKAFMLIDKDDAFRFDPEITDEWSLIEYNDGRKQRVEFYFGSGYLSQSSITIFIPRKATQMVVYDHLGKSRLITSTQMANEKVSTIKSKSKK
jgi:hypothetical protein